MNYYCMAVDATSFGAPWKAIDVRYPTGPMGWTPGSAWVLDDFEKDHNYLDVKFKGTAAQANAIAAFKDRLAETRAACPEGTPIALYATPCFWNSSWNTLSAAKKADLCFHWCGIIETIEADMLAVCMYDVYPDADPTDGNQHAAIEAKVQVGRATLGTMVRETTGKALNLVLCHRQKSLGKGGMGRILTRAEVDPLLVLIRQVQPDGVVFWHGDVAWTGCLCNPAVQMSEQARADMRADWHAETWHPDEVPDWESNMKRVQHVAAANRRAFANAVYCGTKDWT